MTIASASRLTEDEYLYLERRSQVRHELLGGQLVAMVSGSPKHNAIVANVVVRLGAPLRGGPCAVLTGNQRVHVEATGLYTYPDVSVVCGQPRFHPKDRETLLNPKVIVEVLSDATEKHDRGIKFAHYRTIPSLQEVALVSHTERRVEHYRRLETGQWLMTESQGATGVVRFPALGCCEIALADIYENAERFERPPSGPPAPA